ncbi:hypothetical protein D9758_011580 [Tetrapyrgos nigripes]|uniref:Heterokaryon incompatibility domain-containing protein n=1 Tax=Tetrapyrgos nigripes TaxID=182062 RepID=A0A8H5CPB0_9AGAR|nr:hypothetical protein D9758_011580 [Tetrapyrgos nigripes]
MRLLNTETFQLQEYYTDIPAYAILSHTWDKEEVTFRDMQNLEVAKKKAGFAKIRGACAHARKYAFEWIWIDSCCINKESSAELSEAINSMYEYYRDSQVCYAYLSDASSAEDPRDTKSGFRSSRWFKRGWTLQELLAPRYVVFLGQDWEEIGTRWSLKDAISVLTRIPSRVFEDGRLESYSIAQRMSWAALRETTRPEDKAYCLMGIFGVNMPPLYGEGSEKAFTRLQHEIIKVSDDRSIFAWIAPVGEKGPRGLFARSPFEFRMSEKFRPLKRILLTTTPLTFSRTMVYTYTYLSRKLLLAIWTAGGRCLLQHSIVGLKTATISPSICRTSMDGDMFAIGQMSW